MKKQKQTIRRKSLFEHINQVTSIQNKTYWKRISDEDKKTWSNFMVNRFLSMNSNWIELVNEVQQYDLPPEILYKLYIDILPKRKVWLKYIKGRKQMLEYPRWALDIISTHYQVNLQEAKNYAEMFLLTEGGAYELAELFGKYGVEPKEIKKLGLPIE